MKRHEIACAESESENASAQLLCSADVVRGKEMARKQKRRTGSQRRKTIRVNKINVYDNPLCIASSGVVGASQTPPHNNSQFSICCYAAVAWASASMCAWGKSSLRQIFSCRNAERFFSSLSIRRYKHLWICSRLSSCYFILAWNTLKQRWKQTQFNCILWFFQLRFSFLSQM